MNTKQFFICYHFLTVIITITIQVIPSLLIVIINAKVYEYGSLLLFHVKITEGIWMYFGIEIDL